MACIKKAVLDHKLDNPYFGPHRIIEIVGPTTYKFEGLPKGMHDTFHVSKLKAFQPPFLLGNQINPPPPFQPTTPLPQPDLAPSEDGDYEVESIQGHRRLLKKGKEFHEYLIKWKDYDNFHNSWEPERHLTCPELVLDFHRVSNSNSIPPLAVRSARHVKNGPTTSRGWQYELGVPNPASRTIAWSWTIETNFTKIQQRLLTAHRAKL